MTKHIITALLLAASITGGGVASAQSSSQGTTAGSRVDNTAVVTYETDGVDQQPVSSNTSSFIVDRKVSLLVTEVGNTATVVSQGQTKQYLVYTVTNNTNAPIDALLVIRQRTSGRTNPAGVDDTFDATNLKVERYDAPGDYWIDGNVLHEMQPDQTIQVRIYGDIPTDARGAAGVFLLAEAHEVGPDYDTAGARITASTGADQEGVMQTILRDTAGPAGDAANDGVASAEDSYVVEVDKVTVHKSSTVVSDPYNGTSDPKRIPGAVIRYCVAVVNEGSKSISNVRIRDEITRELEFVNDSELIDVTVTKSGSDYLCGTDGRMANTYISDNVLTTTISDVPAGTSRGFVFRATIR